MNGSELVVEIYGGAFSQDVVLAPLLEVEVIGLKPESGYSFHQWVEERKKMPIEEIFALEIESQREAEEQGQLEEYLQGSYEQGVFEEEMKDVMPEPPVMEKVPLFRGPVSESELARAAIEYSRQWPGKYLESARGLMGEAIYEPTTEEGERATEEVKERVWADVMAGNFDREIFEGRIEEEKEDLFLGDVDQGAFLDEMSSELW